MASLSDRRRALATLEALKNFRKRAPRHSVNLNAWIRRTDSLAIQDCRVVDISQSGVKLEVENADSLPDNFLLLFSKSDAGSHISVVWRHGTQIGAKFIANPPPPRASLPAQ